MFTTVAQQVAHQAVDQGTPAQVHHSDVGDQSGSITRNAHSTGCEPNLILLQSNTNLSRRRRWRSNGTWKFSARTCHMFSSAWQTAREDPGAVQRAAGEEHMEKFNTTPRASLQYSVPGSSSQGLLEVSELQCLALPAGTIQSWPRNQRVAYEEVEIAVVLFTSRTAEASFSNQQRG